jgi:hypothetical protein
MLRAAAAHAQHLSQAHGWNRSTLRLVLDGLTVMLDGHLAGERVTLTEVRTRTPRHASTPRVAEVLTDLGLLDDDTTPAIRSWIDRRTGELPAGFVDAVRAWLLVLLDGDKRTRPRSQFTIYVYFATVRPFLEPRSMGACPSLWTGRRSRNLVRSLSTWRLMTPNRLCSGRCRSISTSWPTCLRAVTMSAMDS